jgi:hypothetical protein
MSVGSGTKGESEFPLVVMVGSPFQKSGAGVSTRPRVNQAALLAFLAFAGLGQGRSTKDMPCGNQRFSFFIRYFFYLTNDWFTEADEIVFTANDRCNQENLLAQLHGGVRSLTAPVDNLVSNWAYMVMTGLAWNLKAWWALMLPEEPGRWQARYRVEKAWVL